MSQEPLHTTGPSPSFGSDAPGEGPAFLDDVRWLEQLARRLAGDPFLAADACQNVWLAWTRERGLDGASTDEGHTDGRRADRASLARRLRQALWLLRRSDERRRRREERAPDPEPVPSTAELLARGEERERAWRALAELDEPFRAVLLLRFESGLTPPEIARRLDLRQDTVRWRLRRGIELLRERLGHRVEPRGHAPSSRLAPAWWFAWLATWAHGSRASAASAGGTFASSVPTSLILMSKAALATLIAAGVGWLVLLFVRPGDEPGPTENLARGSSAVVQQASTEADAVVLAATEDPESLRNALPARGVAAEVAADAPVLRIVGRALERDGRGGTSPLADALATAQVEDGWKVEARSDGHGRFELDLPPGAELDVVADVEVALVGGEFHARRVLRVESSELTDVGAAHSADPGTVEVGDVLLEPAGVIEARCVDAAGAPIPGATLRIVGHWTWPVSDDDGRWRVAHVPVGLVDLAVRERGWFEEKRRVQLEGGRVERLDPFVLEEAAIVRGVVTDASGRPLRGASVSTRGYTRGFTFECDDDGRFEAQLSQRTGSELSARAPGHFQRDGVSVVPGESDLVVVLQSLGDPCAVRVVAADTGESLAEVGLAVLRAGSGWVPTRVEDLYTDPPTVRATANGVVRFTARPGHDRLDLWAPGYVRRVVELEDGARSPSESDSRPSSSNTASNATSDGDSPPVLLAQVVTLERATGLHGRVVARDAATGEWRGVPGVEVELVNGELALYDDAEGLEPLASGAWRQHHLADALGRQGGYSLPEIHPLDRPLPAIGLDRLLVDVVARTTTGADGSFTFERPAVGGMYALARDPANGRIGRSELLASGEATGFGDVEIAAPAAIRGLLRARSRADLEGHTVLIRGAGGAAARTNADGTFELTGLAPGDQLLQLRLVDGRAIVPDDFCSTFHLRLGPGEDRAVAIDVPTEPATNLNLIATLNGEPIAGGWLLAETLDGSLSTSADLDGAGAVRFAVPAERELRFLVEHDGHSIALASRLTFEVGDASAALTFETFHLEVELQHDVDRSREQRPTLLCDVAGRGEKLVGTLVREGAFGPVYRFDHVPIEATGLRVAPRSGADGTWSLDVDERLAGAERRPGAVLAF